MRADARRNYERLLEVGREALAEHGAEASLDDIASRAGVGSATLYRHFPRRADLIDAVIRDWVVGLYTSAQELLEADDPREALNTWIRDFAAHISMFRGLSQQIISCVDSTSADDSPLYGSCEVMHHSLTQLLTRAQQTGAVRRELSADDLGRLINGIVQATETAPDGRRQAQRLLEVALSGIAAE